MNSNLATAQNYFSEGLLMDLSPNVKQNTTLSSALNATLVTFNGNEMVLQNDMGNGRVETARLPEGYIPMGSCEFGDIIYVVSYNPLINKSQIGCFPSPERNITQDESETPSDGGISWENFQEYTEITTNGKLKKIPTGKIKHTSLKKVLITKNLNPGDQYIIMASNLHDNADCLSDYGNNKKIHGINPKFVKINIVSIEDSGKINYLNSDTKWYSLNSDGYFYIKHDDNIESPEQSQELSDADYSVFQNKISGKLALLIELETINSFSCTYSVYKTHESKFFITPEQPLIQWDNYDVYLNTSWETNNVNPIGFSITNSEWKKNKVYQIENKGTNEKPNYIVSEKYFKLEDLPVSTSKTEEGIYKCEVKYSNNTENQDCKSILLCRDKNNIPQVDSNGINQYYDSLATLKYEEGTLKGYDINNNPIVPVSISDVVVNNKYHKDIVKKLCSIKIPKRQQVDGTFVDLIKKDLVWSFDTSPAMPYGILDFLKVNNTIDFGKINSGEINLTGWRYYNQGLNSNLQFDLECYPEPNKGISEIVLDFYDPDGLAASYHIKNKSSYSGTFNENIIFNSIKNHKQSGIIYANALYNVLITVKYCNIDSLGNYLDEDNSQYKYFLRWYYTFEIFNDKYFSVKDFSILNPQLVLDMQAELSGNNVKIQNTLQEKDNFDKNSQIYETRGVNIQSLNNEQLTLTLSHGLLENFGLFNLIQPDENQNYIESKIILGNSKIIVPNQIKQLSEEESEIYSNLIPIISKNLDNTGLDSLPPIYELDNSYKSYQDYFKLEFNDELIKPTDPTEFTYIDLDNKEQTVTNKYVSKGIIENTCNLKLSGKFYNKYQFSKINKYDNIKCVKSILHQEKDISSLGLRYYNNHLFFNEVQTIHMGESGGKNTRWGGYHFNNSSGENWSGDKDFELKVSDHNQWRPNLENSEVQAVFSNVKHYLTPVIISKYQSSNAKIDDIVFDRKNQMQSLFSSSEYHFNSPTSIYDSVKNIPNSDLIQSSPYMINFLCFRDIDSGLVYITNDPFISGGESQKYLGLTNNGINQNMTQADIVGGLYSQIYSKIPGTYTQYQKNNLVYLSPFTEIWSKDIIVNSSIVLNDKDNINSKILFRQVKFEELVNKINSNLPQIVNLPVQNNNNVNFKILNSQKVFNYKFNLNYDITNAKIKYQSFDQDRLIKCIGANNQITDVFGDVIDNKLYSIENNQIIPLSNASSIKLVTRWSDKLEPVYDTQNIVHSNLGNLFTIDNGFFHIHNYDQFPEFNNKFKIMWYGTGDDPWIANIPGGSIFNRIKI